MKKILLLFLLVFSISTSLIGCSSAKQGLEDGMKSNQTQYTIEIEVEFNDHVSGNKHLTVVGKTNLPEGEEVLITLISEKNNFIASSKDTVKDGIYMSEPFSKQGESLPSGEYKITVNTSNSDKAKQEKVINID